MSHVLVVAPHPDDETLGCGGSLLRFKEEGHSLHWLTITGINAQMGFSAHRVLEREKEIEAVFRGYGFSTQNHLMFEPGKLDSIPLQNIIEKCAAVFKSVQPEIVLLPHRGDSHSDHRASFDAAAACTKWFRYPSVKRVLCYETLSETDAALGDSRQFTPNVFVDISRFLDHKIEMMMTYVSELGEFPFPRSAEAIRAQAKFRGASAGYNAAEAFCLMRERL